MAKVAMSGPDYGPLEIHAGGLGRICLIIVVTSLSVVGSAFLGDGLQETAGRLFAALMGVLLLLAVFRHVRWRLKGCLVRLDDAGITLFGSRTVAWTEIAEVCEMHRGSTEALAFLPRRGADLPVFWTPVLGQQPRRGTERLILRWGSPLVLFPGMLDVSRTQIIDAVRRFSGGVPILDEQRELVVS